MIIGPTIEHLLLVRYIVGGQTRGAPERCRVLEQQVVTSSQRPQDHIDELEASRSTRSSMLSTCLSLDIVWSLKRWRHGDDSQFVYAAIAGLPLDRLAWRQSNKCRPDRGEDRESVPSNVFIRRIDELKATHRPGARGECDERAHPHDGRRDRVFVRDDRSLHLFLKGLSGLWGSVARSHRQTGKAPVIGFGDDNPRFDCRSHAQDLSAIGIAPGPDGTEQCSKRRTRQWGDPGWSQANCQPLSSGRTMAELGATIA